MRLFASGFAYSGGTCATCVISPRSGCRSTLARAVPRLPSHSVRGALVRLRNAEGSFLAPRQSSLARLNQRLSSAAAHPPPLIFPAHPPGFVARTSLVRKDGSFLARSCSLARCSLFEKKCRTSFVTFFQFDY